MPADTSAITVALLSFLPCLWGFVPRDGPQMALTEKPPIPDGVLIRAQTRDRALRKPDNDERVLEQPSFTILPGLLTAPKLPLVRFASYRSHVCQGGARCKSTRL